MMVFGGGYKMDLLRKKDIIDAVGLAKSTISDWIEEFRVYIPIEKHGNVIYYKPETIQVLQVVKKLRDQGYSKPEIMKLLAEYGFSITVDKEKEEIQKAIQTVNTSDVFVGFLQTLTHTVEQIGEQTDRINKQDGRITELEQMIKELQKELAVTKEEVQNKQQTSFWKRLFSKS